MSDAAAKRPTVLSGALSALAAGTVVALVGTERAVRVGLGVELAGLVLVAAGVAALRRERRALGVAAAALGAAVALAGLAVPVVRLADPRALVDVVPGLIGVAVLCCALVPLRGSGSRWAVRAGIGLVFVAVLTGVVVQEVARGRAVVLATLCVAGWDLGENAVSLGRQLGRRARTWGPETTHALGTAAVGVAGVELLAVVGDLRPPSTSLSTLVVLLVAALALTVAVYE